MAEGPRFHQPRQSPLLQQRGTSLRRFVGVEDPGDEYVDRIASLAWFGRSNNIMLKCVRASLKDVPRVHRRPGGPTMTEQRELSPTQESPEPQPDRSTVYIQPPTLGEADGCKSLTSGQADTEAPAGGEPGTDTPPGVEPDTEASAGGEAASEAPTGEFPDDGPGATRTWTSTRESRDRSSSSSSQALSFDLSARRVARRRWSTRKRGTRQPRRPRVVSQPTRTKRATLFRSIEPLRPRTTPRQASRNRPGRAARGSGRTCRAT